MLVPALVVEAKCGARSAANARECAGSEQIAALVRLTELTVLAGGTAQGWSLRRLGDAGAAGAHGVKRRRPAACHAGGRLRLPSWQVTSVPLHTARTSRACVCLSVKEAGRCGVQAQLRNGAPALPGADVYGDCSAALRVFQPALVPGGTGISIAGDTFCWGCASSDSSVDVV